jgi:hypothetical protein
MVADHRITCAWFAAIVLVLVVAIRPAAAQRAGDCDGDGEVTIAEIVSLVSITLGNAAISACPAGDTDGNGGITIAEIIAAIREWSYDGACRSCWDY